MSKSGSATESAMQKFEEWLVRYHDGAGDFESFCAQHPEHAERFRRWWQRLIDASEVESEEQASPASTRRRSAPSNGAHGTGESVATIDDETGLPAIGTQFGSYQLESELGRGSQGTVFLATDLRLGRKVALKILPAGRLPGSSRTKRFAREAELASRLDHPGLCSVYERGSIGGAAFLAMRLVEGETLAARIVHEKRRSDGARVGRALPLPDVSRAKTEGERIRQILALFERVCDAMDVAHEARLVHRDLKPGNIIVDPSGRPVVLDFGLARHVEEDELTMTGDLVGTPAYMSPEQIAAQRIDIDQRSDVYSLGASLFECLTLRRPFEAPTRQELYQQILTAEAPNARKINPDIPRDLAIVLQASLEKDRRRRYQTMRDFGEDLMRVRTLQPIRARKAGPALRVRRWLQRNTALAASLAVVFLALVAALGVSLSSLAERNRAQDQLARLELSTRLDRARVLGERLLTVDDPAEQLSDARRQKIAAWLEQRGEPLAAAIPDVEASLTELRARALPEDEASREAYRREHELWLERERLVYELEGYRGHLSIVDPDRMTTRFLNLVIEEHEERIRTSSIAIAALRPWRFASPEETVTHAGLAPLLDELRGFAGPGGLLTVLRDEQTAIDELRARAAADANAWRAVEERLVHNERYKSKSLRPQAGLVPLGPDPQSGLEEFAFVRSGRIPVRDENGLELADDTAMVLVLIPGGSFELGSRSSAARFETSIEGIELARYLVSKYELTLGQWDRIGGSKISREIPISQRIVASYGGPSHPAHAISYVVFRAQLRRHALDVPTEAQWEYAARGGRRGSRLFRRWYQNGRPVANLKDRSYFEQGVRRNDTPVPYQDGEALTAVVGSYVPNEYGLYDVIGNVWEFTREAFYPIPLEQFKRDEGDAFHHVPESNLRGVRGGAYDIPRSDLLTRRLRRAKEQPWRSVGVRPVRRVEEAR